MVALKSRTIPAAEAVALSPRSAESLRARGARQLFFKYCSTFDSTDAGNIGPVAEALMERLGANLTLACPAFPANKRTVYMGNLFVGQVPLAESPMRLFLMLRNERVRTLSATEVEELRKRFG